MPQVSGTVLCDEPGWRTLLAAVNQQMKSSRRGPPSRITFGIRRRHKVCGAYILAVRFRRRPWVFPARLQVASSSKTITLRAAQEPPKDDPLFFAVQPTIAAHIWRSTTAP